ncbi:hypothetical protein PHB09_185 [Pseudomonas phage PHB09]|uniref:Uncharacterized protein n=1 Tax=Pseudomonas phage PHB09 TaxID=2867265 RepID=A0AAE8XCI2_9CAUD|nr:hypothetical protein QGX10_gp184 [Pseudomonas phage PHB09]UAV84680.1 hypothetical protein PHB09_185 [Pseudomonas phage PHB09]
MSHGGMTPEQSKEYSDYLKKLQEQLVQGVHLLDDNDKLYLLDKVEESRWMTGATYNKGVHILMDVIQLLVEASYASPNTRL